MLGRTRVVYINPAGGKVMVVGVNGRKVEKGIHVVNLGFLFEPYMFSNKWCLRT